MKVQFSFREHFDLSRKEQRGYLVFLVVLILLTISKQIVQNVKPAIVVDKNWNQNKVQPNISTKKNLTSRYAPILFDPNTCADTVFINHGLPTFISKRIVKYRKSGGRFRKPQDLLNIYGLDTLLYTRMLPYIRISSSRRASKRNALPQKKVKVDLNKADSAQLTTLRGIGPVYASRVVKYRRLLGGFHSEKQLSEVYGITDSLFQTLQGQILCSGTVLKISVNQAEPKELARHPYCSYGTAKVICNYRKLQGSFGSENDLLSVRGIDSTIIERLIPYCSFD
jgi:competence protein ComEA